jgi:hypothetical protein
VHRQDPIRGEAIARDLLFMLKTAQPHRWPAPTDHDLLRARSPKPVQPWLASHLRAAARR